MILKIRQTHSRLYSRCKRLYNLTVVHKLVPKDKKIALSIGTACHAGRATWLRTKDAAESIKDAMKILEVEVELYPTLKSEFTSAQGVVMETIASYCDTFEQRFPGNSIQVLGIELPFEVKIAEFEDLELYVHGTLDADVIYLERYRMNFEFKTVGKPTLDYYVQTEFMSRQHTTYTFAMRELTGEMPYGTLLDMVRKPLVTKGPEHRHEIIPVTPEDFAEIRRDYTEQLKEIRYSMDNDYFPPNFDACFGNKGTCPMYAICRSRFDPHVIRNKFAVVDDIGQIVADIEKENS